MIKKTIVLLSVILSLSACSENDTKEITGRIVMKGASVHTFLAIADMQTSKIAKISNHKVFNLMKRQNEILTLKVKLLKKPVGVGFPAVVEVIEVK